MKYLILYILYIIFNILLINICRKKFNFFIYKVVYFLKVIWLVLLLIVLS